MENVETLGATRPSRLILKAFLEKHIKGRRAFHIFIFTKMLLFNHLLYCSTTVATVSYVILLDVHFRVSRGGSHNKNSNPSISSI